MHGNIEIAVRNKICLTCGICKEICPVGCISFTEKSNVPKVGKKCNKCGRCIRYCPGLSSNVKLYDNINKSIKGKIKKAYLGRTKDYMILKNAVSGGMATEIVRYLLNNGYDYAIGVKNPTFNGNPESIIYTLESYSSDIQKSVYTMPLFSDVVKFINANKSKKLVIIGSGCIISSIKKYVSEVGKIDNYFFIGLICDHTLNKNIEIYYRRFVGRNNKNIYSLEYRSKEKNGWPGDMILYSQLKRINIPREERYMVVPYFKNRRCIFCIDYLNTNADIVLGDNYTDEHTDVLGSNSIIVRTSRGEEVLLALKDMINIYEIPYDELVYSLDLRSKEKNFVFSSIFETQSAISINSKKCAFSKEDYQEYKKSNRRLSVGRIYRYFPLFIDLVFQLRGISKAYNRKIARLEEDGKIK